MKIKEIFLRFLLLKKFILVEGQGQVYRPQTYGKDTVIWRWTKKSALKKKGSCSLWLETIFKLHNGTKHLLIHT